MNARYLARVLLITWVLFALAPVRGAHADNPPPFSQKRVTVLRVEPLRSYAIGDQPMVVAHLSTDAGNPLENRLIRVFAYKNRVTEALTDRTGTARIPLNFNFYPGSYNLLVTFSGSDLDHLDSSFSASILTVIPGTLQVQTVPAIPGVQFAFNGQTQVSDATGMVTFSVDHIGGYHIEVLPVAPSDSQNVRINFDRWNDNDVSTYHAFKFPVHRVLQAGFLINYRVNLRYTDEANQAVDPARISLTRVRAAGTFYSLTDNADSTWLPTNSILHRVGSVLESKPAEYYLDNVTIAGANVVNQGQQRFRVNSGSTWWIHLFLYPASFSAHDALLGSPLGSGILLEYPDGAHRELAFDPGTGQVQLDSLPRGIYHASVQGAQGLEPRIPLSLSRTRSFDLIVISRLDLAIMLGGPALLVILLLVVGRTNAFAWVALRRRAS